MRLKIKIGYFISFLIVVIGMISSLGGYGKASIILYTGLFLLSCAGVFYTLKNLKAKTSSQDWLKLSGYVLIATGVFIHFIVEIDTRIFLLALCALLNPLQIGQTQPYSKT